MTHNIKNSGSKKPKIGYIPVILLVGSIIFFFLSRHAKKDHDHLQRDGILIDGIITDKRISTSDDYDDKYYLEYDYVYQNEEFSDENRVYHELWERTSNNDTILIRILPNKPENSQINSSLIYPENEDYWLIAFILFFNAIIFMLIPYFKSLKENLRKKRYSDD